MRIQPLLVMLICYCLLQGCGLSPRSVFGIEKVKESWTEAPTSLTQPIKRTDIDPLTFDPPKDFTTGAAKGALKDKRKASDASLNACKYAVPGRVAQSTAPTLDGSLTEWESTAIVAIDRIGDGYNADSGADLHGLYVADDEAAIYVGVKLAASWSGTVANEQKIYIEFKALNLDGYIPVVTDVARFLLRDERKLYNDADYPNSVDEALHSVAFGSDSIEFKFTKSESLLELGNIYEVRVYVAKTVDDTAKEQIGSYIHGMSSDYACMVKMPDDSVKMLVMNRYPGQSAGVAEVVFRGFVNGAQETATVFGDGLDLVDTISYNLVPKAGASGIFLGLSGAFTAYKPGFTPKEAFAMGVRQYIRAIGELDYRMLTRWSKEGLAEWNVLQAERSYFGAALWKYEFDAYAREVRENEASGIQPLSGGDDIPDWAIRFKSALLFEFITANSDLAGLRTTLDRRVTSTDSEDSLLANLQSFLGKYFSTHNDMWYGWIKLGEYANSPVSPDSFEDYYGK